MAQAHELVIVLGVLPEAAGTHGHAPLRHPVQTGLGPVVFFKIVDELLGCAGKIQFLGRTGEVCPALTDLLDGGFAVKGHEYGGHVTV